MSLPPLVVLVGPTAVGKTEASLVLAERLGAEIVSADSRLLYRGMDIGTAKPTAEERRRVRHHLVDVAEPDEVWSLAQVRQAVLLALQDITDRKRLPLMVGGTGQYVRAILEGWDPPPYDRDSGIRSRLEGEAREGGGELLHARLRAADPESAARIDARNVRRVVRALEIHEVTGIAASTQRRRAPPGYHTLRLGLALPRPVLYARIDARLEHMLRDGWVDEVRRLLAKGYGPAMPAFSAIGYSQIAEVVQGKRTLEDAAAEIRKRTRVFVRRQANWFKPNDPNIRWFESEPGTIDQIEREIRGWLADSAS
jgi:tRNA dimethylallyltransferase